MVGVAVIFNDKVAGTEQRQQADLHAAQTMQRHAGVVSESRNRTMDINLPASDSAEGHKAQATDMLSIDHQVHVYSSVGSRFNVNVAFTNRFPPVSFCEQSIA